MSRVYGSATVNAALDSAEAGCSVVDKAAIRRSLFILALSDSTFLDNSRMSYVLAHLLLANNGLSSKAGLIVINNRYHRPDTPNCVGHTPIVHLRLKDFREVGSLTTLILATDTDIIIQIPAVFVKTTKAKSRKKRENLYQDSA